LNFSKCKVISSPGVAALLEITFKVTDDYKGKLVFCCLDDFMENVLRMAKVFTMASSAKNFEEALSLLA